MLSLFSFTASSQDFEGTWLWSYNDGEHKVELSIGQYITPIGVSLGQYCSVFYDGRKVDCDYKNSNGYGIVIRNQINDNVYEASILPNSDQTQESTLKARFTILNSNKIKVEIIEYQEVPSEYYFPKTAIFDRI